METQESVHEWTTKTFPNNADPSKRLWAFLEEAFELLFAEGFHYVAVQEAAYKVYRKCEAQYYNNMEESAEAEAGDVYSCLLSYAAAKGFSLQDELDKKMAICRAKPQSYFDMKQAQKGL